MWVGALEDYTTYLMAAGCASSTVKLKRTYVRRLAEQVPAGPWDVTTDDLVRFVGHDGWMPETRNSARSSVRTFYEWAFITGRIPENPAIRLPSVKVPIGMPNPTPLTVVRRALGHADVRAKRMVSLAVYAGLRVHEIAKVHSDDLLEDLVGTSLSVLGKGRRTRLVPLDDLLADELRSLPPGWVFPGMIEGEHLSADRVGEIVSDLLGPRWSAHTLRHRFATSAYATDRDLFAVQRLLGHSNPATTARYTAVPDASLRTAVNGVRGIIAA